MADTLIYLEPFNVVYFPCDVSCIEFSPDSNHLAIAGGEGLVVLRANTQLSMFEPIARDVVGKEDIILRLRWTTSKSIEYFHWSTHNCSVQIHHVNIPTTKSELVVRPVDTSYTFDSFWESKRTPRRCGNEQRRYELRPNSGYCTGVSTRSVEIWKFSSKSASKNGFVSKTVKVETISNIEKSENQHEYPTDTKIQLGKRRRDIASSEESQPSKKSKGIEDGSSPAVKSDAEASMDPTDTKIQLGKRRRDIASSEESQPSKKSKGIEDGSSPAVKNDAEASMDPTDTKIQLGKRRRDIASSEESQPSKKSKGIEDGSSPAVKSDAAASIDWQPVMPKQPYF